MIRYLAARLVAAAVVLAVVATVVFVLFEALPGDAAESLLARGGATAVPPDQLAALRTELGLDRPAPVRFADWLGGVLRGDLGTSLVSRRPVAEVIGVRTANSAVLALVTVIVLVPASLVLGLVAGARPGGRLDRVISAVALGAEAVPTFVAGVFLIVVVALGWGLLPAVSLVPTGTSPLARPEVLVLPVACLLLGLAPHPVRIVRVRTAEAMASEHVRTARLNGVPERRLLLRHVLPNAVPAALHPIAGAVVALVGGIAVVELIFGYPGLASELLRGVTGRDFPLVQSAAVLMAAFGLLVYLVADLLALALSPVARRALLAAGR